MEQFHAAYVQYSITVILVVIRVNYPGLDWSSNNPDECYDIMKLEPNLSRLCSYRRNDFSSGIQSLV